MRKRLHDEETNDPQRDNHQDEDDKDEDEEDDDVDFGFNHIDFHHFHKSPVTIIPSPSWSAARPLRQQPTRFPWLQRLWWTRSQKTYQLCNNKTKNKKTTTTTTTNITTTTATSQYFYDYYYYYYHNCAIACLKALVTIPSSSSWSSIFFLLLTLSASFSSSFSFFLSLSSFSYSASSFSSPSSLSSPYLKLSPLSNVLLFRMNLRSQSIIFYTNYFLFASLSPPSSLTVSAESIQGLRLNSFIPHFEPLFYDRNQLLQQYSRLKRSFNKAKVPLSQTLTEVDVKKKNKIVKSKRKRKRTRTKREVSVTSTTPPNDGHQLNVISIVRSNGSDDSFHSSPHHNDRHDNYVHRNEDNENDIGANSRSTVSTFATASNQSIASTTAFFRHNCPLPNDKRIDDPENYAYHHQHHHHPQHDLQPASPNLLNFSSKQSYHYQPEQAPDSSTERMMLRKDMEIEKRTTASISGVSDSGWLQYDAANSDIGNDTDTDASIDIDDSDLTGEGNDDVDDDYDDLDDDNTNMIMTIIDDEEKVPPSTISHSADDHGEHIRVEFTTHNRRFRLKLKSHSERVFAPDPIFEFSDGRRFQYDISKTVRGHLEDDEDTIFEGVITRDGLLDGHLITRNDEFYIEPASLYFGTNHGRDFHSVIYSTLLVDFPNATHGSTSPYGAANFHSLLNPFNRNFALSNHWLGDNHKPWSLLNDIEEILHRTPTQRQQKRPKRSIDSSEDVSFVRTSTEQYAPTQTDNMPTLYASNHSLEFNSTNVDSNNFIERRHKLVFESNGGAKKMPSSFVTSSSTSSSSSSLSLPKIPSKAERFRKNGNSVGTDRHGHGHIWREMDSLHYYYTESEKYGMKAGSGNTRTHWVADDQRHHDRHVVVDPKKTTCMLYLQADHLFFEKMGSEEACIESMTRHVQKVNNIYKNTDFDQDGRPDNISFLIKRIKVHTLEALKDPEYRYPSTYGVEKFLELFSEEDYDAFCLAYMFTYRDFEGGTLGLAWTGDLKNAGGVCEKNGHYRGSLKSLNTGIVTLLNYGKHVPPIVSHVTLAHEIGHNFGSPHDPEDDHACTPGGENGNYIMFARATSGDKRNNNKFSPCSLRSINAVLNTKAKSLKGCFQELKPFQPL